MFSNCLSLKELNLNNFKTNNVIEIKAMFSDCCSLKYLNLINFNTEKVTDMRWIFSSIQNCTIKTEDKKLLEEINKE